jgi:hypothetical protein
VYETGLETIEINKHAKHPRVLRSQFLVGKSHAINRLLNVMTRDTQGLHDGRDLTSDGEIHAALWAAAAPFPNLPNDAPTELRKLAIDIDDPKRVYAIHRASRRHHFQILVER